MIVITSDFGILFFKKEQSSVFKFPKTGRVFRDLDERCNGRDPETPLEFWGNSSAQPLSSQKG